MHRIPARSVIVFCLVVSLLDCAAQADWNFSSNESAETPTRGETSPDHYGSATGSNLRLSPESESQVSSPTTIEVTELPDFVTLNRTELKFTIHPAYGLNFESKKQVRLPGSSRRQYQASMPSMGQASSSNAGVMTKQVSFRSVRPSFEPNLLAPDHQLWMDSHSENLRNQFHQQASRQAQINTRWMARMVTIILSGAILLSVAFVGVVVWVRSRASF